MATDVRLSQDPVEVLASASPNPSARLSQEPIEVLVGAANPYIRLSQIPIEILLDATTFNNGRMHHMSLLGVGI